MTLLDREPDELRALLEYATDDETAIIVQALELDRLEEDPLCWLRTLFPVHFKAPFAPHHDQFWAWLWTIGVDDSPESYVGVWPRGGAKSTSAEVGVVALAARRARRYGLYVSETQDQANDHVQNIASLLETDMVGHLYPDLGRRLVGKYGSSKGWRRNRLRTADGFTIDALGLDVAARGVKLDEDRPDLIVFDDLDSEDDGPGQIERKLQAITRKLIPAGAPTLAVLAIQNLVHPQGIFARLAGVAEEPAEFLQRRIVSGPIPAIDGLTVEDHDGQWTIIDGRPTWAGQDLERCQAMMTRMGVTAFRAECQHETDARGGGMFDHLNFAHCTLDQLPALRRTEVWVDPAVTASDNSDSMGIIADGIADSGTIYRLRAWERRATPVVALKLAICWAIELGAGRVGIETDQGRDTWTSVYREACDAVMTDLGQLANDVPVDGPDEYLAALIAIVGPVKFPPMAERQAGVTQMSKASRASKMLVDYERPGRIVHVLGTHLVLERALNRFPRSKPYDLVDAAYWSWRAIRAGGKAGRRSTGAYAQQL